MVGMIEQTNKTKLNANTEMFKIRCTETRKNSECILVA